MNGELANKLRRIADASTRADGSDIPLGEQLRAAADALDAANKRIAELEAGWQLIETSPKHTSIILCSWWRDHPNMPFVAEGYLDWDGVTWRYQSAERLPADILPPTHWRPFPAAPAKEEDNG